MKKSISLLCVLLSVFFAFSCTAELPASAAYNYYKINVAEHTQEEIAAYIAEHNFDVYAFDEYDEDPSDSAPYKYGVLSDKTLNNALNIVNAIRYCAGLQEVQLDDSYATISQAACVCNSANGGLSHKPKRPEGMDDEFYNNALTGAGQSNLCMGYGSLSRGVVYAWTSDGDTRNRDVLGHRRWVLYPQMGVTYFGACDRYNSMYVWDGSNYTASETGIAWPAKNTPVELFDDRAPWCISFAAPYKPDGEDNIPINISNTTVKVESLTEDKVWFFSENESDGDFYFDRGGYGLPCCVIFAPKDIIVTAGKKYRVTISSPIGDLTYTVDFFDHESVEKPLLGDVTGDKNITTADALVVLRHVVGIKLLDNDMIAVADVNKNNRVNTADALLIQRYTLGIETHCDIGKPIEQASACSQ